METSDITGSSQPARLLWSQAGGWPLGREAIFSKEEQTMVPTTYQLVLSPPEVQGTSHALSHLILTITGEWATVPSPTEQTE